MILIKKSSDMQTPPKKTKKTLKSGGRKGLTMPIGGDKLDRTSIYMI